MRDLFNFVSGKGKWTWKSTLAAFSISFALTFAVASASSISDVYKGNTETATHSTLTPHGLR